MSSEPMFLQVGLTAWVLQHALASKGAHSVADECEYVPASECTFTVAFTVATEPKDEDFIDLPLVQVSPDPANPFAPLAAASIPFPGALPIVIRVSATPTKKITIRSQHGDGEPVADTSTEVGYFEATAYFIYLGGGVWTRHSRSAEEDETNSALHFSPPLTLSGQLPAPFVFTFIGFFLSRVRDRTTQALRVLQAGGTEPGEWLPASAKFKFLREPPVENKRVVFSTETVDRNGDFRILEVKSFKGPALLAVSWPFENSAQDLAPGTMFAMRAKPMEALVFFHASFGQNAPIYNKTPYPFGWNQMSSGLRKYLAPNPDPLMAPAPFSIPYHVAAAGKHCVAILPLNRVAKPELPNLNFADQAVEVLEEVHAAFLRFAGFHFWTPQLGRLALGAFSAGLNEMFLFSRRARSNALLNRLVQEFYYFEPRHDNGPECINYGVALKGWAGNVPERRVRVYNNESSDGHRDFVGAKQLPAAPFVVDSTDGRFTCGVVPDRGWLNANEGINRFAFPIRKDLAVARLATAAKAGADKIAVTSTAGFRPGDLILVAKAEVHKIASVAGKQLVLGSPLLADRPEDSILYSFEPRTFRTALAADTDVGEAVVLLVSAAPLAEGDRIAVAEEEFHLVQSVSGNEVTFQTPLEKPRNQGDDISLVEPFVRTILLADHPAGSTVLDVHDPVRRGFAKGNQIAIAEEEFAKVTAIGSGSLTISPPLAKDRPLRSFVNKIEERVLFWGACHETFPSVFLVDALRKSGFR